VACYVLVLLLGVSHVRSRYTTLALYLGAIVYLEIVEHLVADPHAELPGPDRLLDLGAKFLAGALAYQWRVVLRARWAWLALAILALALPLGEFRSAERSALPYLVLFLALGTARRLPALTRFGDLSYGTYIYAWPVSQCVALALPKPSWFSVALIATPIVLGLAFASWHLVEKRALAYKARPAPASGPALDAWPGRAR
jgi:peptidoglycan/LPS O-acetylase OafA/YrhL